VPVVIKTSDLHDTAAVQALLSSEQVLPVPSMVNDIAEALPWMLEAENFPLPFAYKAVLLQLYKGFKQILTDICTCIFNNYCVDLLPASITLFSQFIM